MLEESFSHNHFATLSLTLLSLYSPLIAANKALLSPKRIHLKIPLELIPRLIVLPPLLSSHLTSDCPQPWRSSATSSCVTRPWPRPGAPSPSPAGWWASWSASPSSPPHQGSWTGRTLSGRTQVN